MSTEFEKAYHIFFWDTETTGLFSYANPPAILDLALVDSKTGETEAWLVNPAGIPIARQAQNVHGIDLAMVSNCDCFGDIALQMFNFIRTKAKNATPVLCGFNSQRFDNLVLLAELQRYGLDLPTGWMFADLFPHLQQRSSRNRAPILLSDELAEAKNRKLTTIFEIISGEPLSGAHRAATDASALLSVWKVVRARHPDFQLPVMSAEEARGPRWGELRIRACPSKIDDVSAIATKQCGGSAAKDDASGNQLQLGTCVAGSVKKPVCAPDSAPVDSLHGIGPKTRAALEADGIATVGALRALFAGPFASSPAALGERIRGVLHVPLGEEHVRRIAEQLGCAINSNEARGARSVRDCPRKTDECETARNQRPGPATTHNAASDGKAAHDSSSVDVRKSISAPDSAPVDSLHGIGPKTRAALEADGVATVGALRALFAGPLASSPAALGEHIRDVLHVPLGEEHVRRVAEQLGGAQPLSAA